MNFEFLIEKISNPLRKKSLGGYSRNILSDEESIKNWKDYILNSEIEDPVDQKIKDDYLKLKKNFPQRAENWLNQQAKNYSVSIKREKTSQYSKIYEDQGIQVFLDNLADPEFVNDPYKMRMLKFSLKRMLRETRGILPNRKPRFVITSGYKNPRFKNLHSQNPPAIYRDRIIFIDENSVDDPDIFIHEYAHYVADLIPTQTEPLLKKSYDELLDFYWRRVKKKKISLQSKPNDSISMQETRKWRDKISSKLGFPQYGLTNFDEFFAVLIENWHKLPNNTATYKFKSLVKDTINRL
jgi:hypothetical protein